MGLNELLYSQRLKEVVKCDRSGDGSPTAVASSSGS